MVGKRGVCHRVLPEALVLTPEAPYPPTSGGLMRTASLLAYLAGRHTVDVITFREPGAPDPAAAFPAGLARHIGVIDLPFHHKHPAARVLRNAGRLLRGVPPLVDRFAGFGARLRNLTAGRRYALGLVEHFWCAPYVEDLAGCCGRVVLDLVDIESVLYARYASAAAFPASLAHSQFARACRRLERRWLPRFDLLLATSENDAAAARALAPGTRVTVYPNALPSRPVPARGDDYAVVFPANFGYQPNIDGVRWFRREIWPLLATRCPGLKWRLAGKNEECVSGYIAGAPGIETTGPIPDGVAEIARAQVAVVPLRAASGTRLKILEAWAAGVPVVSTTVGAEGLPARHGENLLLADTARDFASAVAALLDSPEMRERVGRAGRERFEREYTWERAWQGLDF